MAGIVVLGELGEGGLQSITGELLAAAQTLAGPLGEDVAAALLGSGLDGVGSEAISLGADRVFLVQDPLLADLQVDAYLAAFELVCKLYEPRVVLVGKTPLGSDVGPRLAYRLGVAVAQDCVDVSTSPGSTRVVATRPVYGGNALAKVTFPGVDPQVVVLRPKVYEPLEPDSSRSGEAVPVEANLDASVVKSRVVETVREKPEGVRLEDAAIVISGGRGLGGPDPFAMLEELAQLLGAAVGASRAVCDAGWIDHGYQVGLTGKTIAPNLYITVGISGASQHMAGCSGAKHIVSINRDADANIFKAASFGVVGQWENVLPSFIETVRGLVKS